jgi:hypothetical protein
MNRHQNAGRRATAKKNISKTKPTPQRKQIHTKRSKKSITTPSPLTTQTSSISTLTTSRSALTAPQPVRKLQKRSNYAFVNISGPKDERYLDQGEVWVPPKARLFDNSLIFSSIILERPPICLKPLPDWEVDFYTYRHSKLSENAWVLPKDLEKNMYGKYLVEDEGPEPLPHITADDKENNRRSLYRALEDPVYLICKVKQDFDEKLPSEIWMFPTTQVREGEDIRSSAERTLFYHAGDLQFYTLGNAPILSHNVRQSDMLKKEYPGVKNVKNFYMHSVYLGGNIELEPDGEITDYAWVTQPELKEYFTSDHTKELEKLTSSSLYYIHAE